MKREVKIALVAITGLVILFFGLNFLKGLNMFSNSDVYYITFHNVDGVEQNTPIYADGVKVGQVSDIEYDYSHQNPTRLTVAIDKQMRIPFGSVAEVASDLMGNTQVNLLLANNPRQKINPGEVIKGLEEDGTIDKLKQMVPTLQAMGPKLDSILTALNGILHDPAIVATLHNAETASSNLTTTTEQLNVLIAGLNHSVPGMIKKADGVLDNANVAAGNLAQLDLQGTLNQVNQTLAGVQQTVDKLNSTEGTVGKLLNDPGLYNNLNSTMQHADSLVIDLKSHPKRYVHFSIW